MRRLRRYRRRPLCPYCAKGDDTCPACEHRADTAVYGPDTVSTEDANTLADYAAARAYGGGRP